MNIEWCYFLWYEGLGVVCILHQCFGMNHIVGVAGSVFKCLFTLEFLIWRLSLAKAGGLSGKQRAKIKKKKPASVRRCLFPWRCGACACVYDDLTHAYSPRRPLPPPGCRQALPPRSHDSEINTMDTVHLQDAPSGLSGLPGPLAGFLTFPQTRRRGRLIT